MSHIPAIRCTTCGVVDDPRCPECGTPASFHGTTDQKPFRVQGEGYVHQWHPDCIPTPEGDPR